MVFRQVWWKGEAESVLEEFCLGNFARDFDPHRLYCYLSLSWIQTTLRLYDGAARLDAVGRNIYVFPDIPETAVRDCSLGLDKCLARSGELY
jgi:hypothetical protein